MCILCCQGGIPDIKLTSEEIKDGIVIFMVSDISCQQGNVVVGNTFDKSSELYHHIYDKYLAGIWEPDLFDHVDPYPFPDPE
jgi:hypothetical protein